MNTILFQIFLTMGILTMFCTMIYLGIRSWASLSSSVPKQEYVAATRNLKENPSPIEEQTDPMLMQSGGVDGIASYEMTFLRSVRFAQKTAFTMNVETLEVLRHILRDLDVRISMASYIENILRDHLRRHRTLLNTAIEQNQRTKTINL